MKPLDMADKYDPLSYQDEYADSEPTIKVQVPSFLPKVTVSDEGEEEYDLYGHRDTIPSPPSYPECVDGHTETRYPGVGLLIVLGFGLTFWSLVAYFIFR